MGMGCVRVQDVKSSAAKKAAYFPGSGQVKFAAHRDGIGINPFLFDRLKNGGTGPGHKRLAMAPLLKPFYKV